MKRWMRRFQRTSRKASEESQNEYYENISAGLGVFQVILYLSLFAFVVLSFFRNTNLITYQNFYYFFKDLGASAESVDTVAADTVSYPTSDEQSFTLYRKGLAVAGNRSVTVFTATGRQTISKSVTYKSPIAIGSGKYLLVYELGGTQYSLYNSYTQIYAGKSDFPIFGATISEEGMYALLSRSEEYTSVVSLYSSHFSLLNRYNKNGYVMDLALNEKGTQLAILTSEVQNGLFQTVLSLHEPKSADVGVSVSIGNSVALSCAYTASGGVSLLCGDRYCYVTQKGELREEYFFDGEEISCMELASDGAVLCLRSDAISEKKHFIVFDKNGKMVYNESAEMHVTSVCREENSVFFMTRRGVTRLNLRDGSISEHLCHTENIRILAINEDEVLLCSPQKASYVFFN